MDTPATDRGRFLDLDADLSLYSSSRVAVWPVPYERTTSWKQGTRLAPEAILEASAQVEVYDDELKWDPARVGIHTLDKTDASSLDETRGIELLHLKASQFVQDDKFLVTLGGEHTLSTPIVHAFKEKYLNLSVLQVDAHADLRDRYEGTPYSHACVMRRILEICPAVQVGIRSISKEESDAAATLPTRLFFARDIAKNPDWVEDAVQALTDTVYVTIDVDGLDPSIMPATGTPEPGGLDWYTILTLLRRIGRDRTIVGVDIVELRPTKGMHAADFLCAKLAYKAIGYAFDSRREGT
jgi:agmatinase